MVYFDNSATTQIDKHVLETYINVATTYFANPSSLHRLGDESKQLLEQARKQVSQLLEVTPEEIYFTSSATEANNWVLQPLALKAREQHPECNRVLLSAIEHPSVLQNKKWLEQQGIMVEFIPVDASGQIVFEELKKLLNNEVLIISTMAVNNEMGAIQSLDKIAELLQDYPSVLWHVDGVQAVTTCFDLLKHPRIDALCLSGHKFHAGRGTGIAMLRNRLCKVPLLFGGSQEWGLRSGTENLASIVATAKALRIAVEQQETTYQRLLKYKTNITQVLLNQGWKIFSNEKTAPNIICASYPGIPGEVLVNAFQTYDCYISTTSACSSKRKQTHHTLQAMQVSEYLSKSAIRISMSHQTTEEDISYLLDVILKVTQQFK